MENIVDVEYLANFFGVTARRVQQWADEDGMPRESRGEYDILKCARWKIRKLEEECEILRNSGDEKLHALKMEGQRIKNKKDELALRKVMGELVDYESVKIAWASETKTFAKALKVMINKLYDALEEVEDRIQKKSIIEREVKAVLNRLGDLDIKEDFDEEEYLQGNNEVDESNV